jgi:D-beta-D-heptose 7-phosphate kinase/D-beta-D-heptose 1-phosphate adenosyltransferase
MTVSNSTSPVVELASLKKQIRALVKKRVIGSDVAERIVLDYLELVKLIEAHRALGKEIIMTIGSYDMFHVGHERYLIKAKNQARLASNAILIVGIDSDFAMKRYKGENRPIIPAIERLELLASQKPIDYVTIIDDIDTGGNWYYGLLRMIRPDVFVAVEDSYSKKQVAEIKEFCKRIIVLPRQAKNTSSTQIIQTVIKSNPKLLKKIQKKR